MNTIEIILSIIIIAAAVYGLFLGGCMKNPNHSRNLLSYYTNLSNIVVLIFEVLLLASCFAPEGGLYAFLRLGETRFVVMNTIFVTFLIYNFILYPAAQLKRQSLTDAEREGGTITPNNVCVHYVVPIGSVVEWLFFADKNIGFDAVGLWLGVPIAYCVYILIRALLKINIYGKDTPYPYFFIDRKVIGTKKFLRSLAVCILAFFLLGCLTYLLTLILR